MHNYFVDDRNNVFEYGFDHDGNFDENAHCRSNVYPSRGMFIFYFYKKCFSSVTE